MVYAVIESGNKQYRVEPGQALSVDLLPLQDGDEVVFDKVLLVSVEGNIKVGSPVLDGAKVVGTVVHSYHSAKKPFIKHHQKKHYRRQGNCRQLLTEVRIASITA